MRAIGFLILTFLFCAAPSFNPFDDKALMGDEDANTSAKPLPADLKPTPTPFASKPISQETPALRPSANFGSAQLEMPQDASALEQKAEALRKRKKYPDARQLFLLIPKNTDNLNLAMDARFRAAQCLFDAEKIDEFEAEAKTLIIRNMAWDRYYRETRMALARIPEKRGQPLEAAHQLEALQKEFSPYPGKGDDQIFEHHIGRLYIKAAAQCQRTGDIKQADDCQKTGRLYLAHERTIIEQRLRNKELPDEYPRRFNFLETYYVENDMNGLETAAAQYCAEFAPPSEFWALGMFWQGVAKKSKGNSAAAAVCFDAIIDANPPDTDEHEHLPASAAFWRASIADSLRDDAGLAKAVQYLLKLSPSETRTKALDRFGS